MAWPKVESATAVQGAGRRTLPVLNNPRSLADLRVPPANRLERLRGDRSAQHSIRIDEHWRLCFVWMHGNARDVDIVDYHR